MGRPVSGVRVFISELCVGDLTLPSEVYHYLQHVRRLGPGDPFIAFDAQGRTATLKLTDTAAVQVASLETTGVSLPISIAMAVPKGDRSDWAVEKLTELGVAQILWFTAERSVKQASNRLDRWMRVAQSAAAQCQRNSLPDICAPVPFDTILAHPAGSKWIADPQGEPVRAPAQPPALWLIGPEGGFTDDERDQAMAAGFVPAKLGPTILRIETAAVTAAAQTLGALSKDE